MTRSAGGVAVFVSGLRFAGMFGGRNLVALLVGLALGAALPRYEGSFAVAAHASFVAEQGHAEPSHVAAIVPAAVLVGGHEVDPVLDPEPDLDPRSGSPFFLSDRPLLL